ncbi:Copper amine oxidase N-terminal domain-containing protein [Clostridium cavendishii DSM 21758]|uniref:Copper amine oxidase N-terminal domain-containing protein n=1 Tax=Clostridium cavendishii DSM 21758 TaxID=1121302 RepID=A0A1M6QK19_9CLOT|nr:DUF2334 domain-containing protein [Clostridium cavendishii]SHK20413.1 Copper amine oxidase N-terminal domain-containing protein [Clostridium cavendishii DSM 21758]
MKRKIIRKVILFISIILALGILAGCNNKEKYKAESKEKVGDTKTKYLDYSKFTKLDMEKIDFKIIFEGKEQNNKLPIYIERNRYYLPITEIINNNSGEIQKKDNILKITFLDKDLNINIGENSFTKGEENLKLKKPLIEKDGFYYLSLYDFSRCFDLRVRINGEKNQVMINKVKREKKTEKYKAKLKTPGFIRLEDVSATNTKFDDEIFERIRIMGDYLNDKGIPYHLAWVPRYVRPADKKDEDPSTKNSNYFADMVYTMDYISDRGGVIGLHGYTHQTGNENTLAGIEFGPRHPGAKYIRERVIAAKKIAEYLDIKVDFFEAPHYEITLEQNKELENHFDYIYHQYINEKGKPVSSNMPIKSNYNGKTYYIWTPLDYVQNGKVEGMISRIEHLPESTMASLFYHPEFEYGFIKLKEGENNYPDFEYDDNANLKRIVAALEKRGYNMMKITDIK